MESGCELVLGAGMILNISSVTAGGNAGGLIGSATDVKLAQIPTINVSSSVSGKNSGSLIGSYKYTGTVDGSLNSISCSFSGITVSANASGGNAGGVFGTLSNAGTFTFAASASVSTTLSGNNVGGLIGQYSASSSTATLQLSQGDVTSALDGAAGAYGGLVGYVSGGTSAYIEAVPSVSYTHLTLPTKA